jgi:RNA polymerase sigma-70 factor, ECF subfamily
MPDPDPQACTSLTLLDLVRSSDQEAWRRLLHLYSPLVVHWCRRRGVSVEDAEDVAQEVFRSAAARIATFRHDRPGDTFRGWLRGFAHNKTLDWHRHQGRQPAVAAGGTEAGMALREVAEAPDFDVDDDPAEVAALYRRALELVKAEFEAKTWGAFWRVAVDGHDTADVARDLGLSTAAVRQAKSRVLRRLRQEVGDAIA